jgi:hypothetical protein
MVRGQIERGAIGIGDRLEAVGQGVTAGATCLEIRLAGEPVQRARAGEAVELALDLAGGRVDPSHVLSMPGALTAHSALSAEIYLLSRVEGGRRTPIFAGYRPRFRVRTLDVVGGITLPEGEEGVMPGDHAAIEVELNAPVPLLLGQRFTINEDARRVGVGVVTGILGDPASRPRAAGRRELASPYYGPTSVWDWAPTYALLHVLPALSGFVLFSVMLAFFARTGRLAALPAPPQRHPAWPNRARSNGRRALVRLALGIARFGPNGGFAPATQMSARSLISCFFIVLLTCLFLTPMVSGSWRAARDDLALSGLELPDERWSFGLIFSAALGALSCSLVLDLRSISTAYRAQGAAMTIRRQAWKLGTQLVLLTFAIISALISFLYYLINYMPPTGWQMHHALPATVTYICYTLCFLFGARCMPYILISRGQLAFSLSATTLWRRLYTAAVCIGLSLTGRQQGLRRLARSADRQRHSGIPGALSASALACIAFWCMLAIAYLSHQLLLVRLSGA